MSTCTKAYFALKCIHFRVRRTSLSFLLEETQNDRKNFSLLPDYKHLQMFAHVRKENVWRHALRNFAAEPRRTYALSTYRVMLLLRLYCRNRISKIQCF